MRRHTAEGVEPAACRLDPCGQFLTLSEHFDVEKVDDDDLLDVKMSAKVQRHPAEEVEPAGRRKR